MSADNDADHKVKLICGVGRQKCNK